MTIAAAQEARAKKALDTLIRYDGRVMSRRSLVKFCLSRGDRVETVRGTKRLTSVDGTFLDSTEIGKIAMTYAEELLNARATS